MLSSAMPRRAGFIIALLCLLAALGSLPTPVMAASDDAEKAAVTARVQEFMNRYEQNDQDGVVAMIDPKEFNLISRPGEIVNNAETLKAAMTRTFQEWKTAKFSSLRDFDVRVGKDVATAWYLFSFNAGEQPTLPIRVVTTWRKVGKQWLLTQCASWALQGQ